MSRVREEEVESPRSKVEVENEGTRTFDFFRPTTSHLNYSPSISPRQRDQFAP